MEAQGVTFFSDSPPLLGPGAHLLPGSPGTVHGGPMLFSQSPAPLRAQVASHRCPSSDGATGCLLFSSAWARRGHEGLGRDSGPAVQGCLAVPCIGTCLQAATCGTDSLDKNGTVAWTDPSRFTLCDQDGTDRREEILAGTDTEGRPRFPDSWLARCRAFFFFFCIQCPFWKMERASSSPCCDRPVKFARGRRKKLPIWICKESKRQTPQLEPPAIEQIGSLWIMIRLRPFEGFHLSPFMYPKPSPSQPRGFPPASSLTSASSSSTL